jgi:hypothetical protein
MPLQRMKSILQGDKGSMHLIQKKWESAKKKSFSLAFYL